MKKRVRIFEPVKIRYQDIDSNIYSFTAMITFYDGISIKFMDRDITIHIRSYKFDSGMTIGQFIVDVTFYITKIYSNLELYDYEFIDNKKKGA